MCSYIFGLSSEDLRRGLDEKFLPTRIKQAQLYSTEVDKTLDIMSQAIQDVIEERGHKAKVRDYDQRLEHAQALFDGYKATMHPLDCDLAHQSLQR